MIAEPRIITNGLVYYIFYKFFFPDPDPVRDTAHLRRRGQAVPGVGPGVLAGGVPQLPS